MANDGRQPCRDCNETGTRGWGANVNGRMTHSGVCYRCQGKGYQTPEDRKRNECYDQHAALRALRGGM